MIYYKYKRIDVVVEHYKVMNEINDAPSQVCCGCSDQTINHLSTSVE